MLDILFSSYNLIKVNKKLQGWQRPPLKSKLKLLGVLGDTVLYWAQSSHTQCTVLSKVPIVSNNIT